MARLFVAVDVPQAQREALAALRDDGLDVRWTPSEQYHLTLRFIGDVNDGAQEAVSSALDGIQLPAFTLAGEGLEVFPSRRRPRVLVARIDARPALLNLQNEVNEAVVACGIGQDPKPFTPHVTFGRVKRAGPREVRTYMKARADFAIESFPVRRFHLYRSDLGSSGAVHTVLRSYFLGDG